MYFFSNLSHIYFNLQLIIGKFTYLLQITQKLIKEAFALFMDP